MNILSPSELEKLFSVPEDTAPGMDRQEWWEFMAWNRRVKGGPSLYEFAMFGLMKFRTEVVRWDHPEWRHAERYFRNDEIRRVV